MIQKLFQIQQSIRTGQLYPLTALFEISHDHSEMDNYFEGIYISSLQSTFASLPFCYISVFFFFFPKQLMILNQKTNGIVFTCRKAIQFILHFIFHLFACRKCKNVQFHKVIRSSSQIQESQLKFLNIDSEKKGGLTAKGHEHLLLPQILSSLWSKTNEAQLQWKVWTGLVQSPGSLFSFLRQNPSTFSNYTSWFQGCDSLLPVCKTQKAWVLMNFANLYIQKHYLRMFRNHFRAVGFDPITMP